MKRLALFLALFVGTCFAQGVRFDSVASTTKIMNGQVVSAPIPNAIITVCTGTATLASGICTPTVQTFTDQTVATPCGGTTQVTLTGSNVCQATSDTQGNFGFWAIPGTYKYTVSGNGVTPQTYTVTIPAGSVAGGGLTSPSINGTIALDGGKYSLTVAGLQQALSDCNASSACTGVDARQLGAVSGTTTTTLPAYRTLWLGSNTAITGTSDPVVCFNNGSAIIGPGEGEETLNTVAAIKTGTAGSRILAPCTAAPRTLYPYFQGINVFNTNGSATAAVVDFTGVSHGTVYASSIQHSGGTGDLVLITPSTGNDSYFNLFSHVKTFGSGAGAAYHLTANAVSGANSNVVSAGKIDNAGDCILIDGTNAQVNDFTLLGVPCENYTGAAVHTIASAQGIKWIGGRVESSQGGATVFNTSLGSSQISMIGVSEFGTQACGTTNGVVSLVEWTPGNACSSVGFEISVTAGIAAANFSASGNVGSTFTGTGANPIATFSNDSITQNVGTRFVDSHAGGHTWEFGETMVNVGHFDLRDKTQTGQPGFGFQVTGTATAEGLFTHALTANRIWTLQDLSGTLSITVASGTAAMTTAAIAAGACGTTVTVAAAGVATTDTITWAFNAAPGGQNAGLVAWPTSGNVNFAYCSNTAETPAAATINWRVVR